MKLIPHDIAGQNLGDVYERDDDCVLAWANMADIRAMRISTDGVHRSPSGRNGDGGNTSDGNFQLHPVPSPLCSNSKAIRLYPVPPSFMAIGVMSPFSMTICLAPPSSMAAGVAPLLSTAPVTSYPGRRWLEASSESGSRRFLDKHAIQRVISSY